MGISSCKYLHELQKDTLKRVYVLKTPDGKQVDDEDEYDDDLETDLGESDMMEDDE